MRKHLLFVALSVLLGGGAQAQEWPNKPLRMIAPFVAGAGPERVIRSITNSLSQRLGQPVVVDYKAGAGGNIGATELARAGADGYSWLIGPDNLVTINPHVYKRTGFEPKDIPAVTLVGGVVHVLVCHPSVGIKSVADLVALAKAKPLSYASGGNGTASHVAMELFLEMAGVSMTHVPYKGPQAATQDLLAGHVPCGFGVQSTVLELVKTNRLTGIAVSTKMRSTVLPELPTMQEAGFKDYDVTVYTVIYGAAKVPANVQARFDQALREVANNPEVKEGMQQGGLIPMWTTSDAAQQELQRQSQRYGVLLRRLNLTLE